MKERPILFSAPMVRALLAGSKTQTRRVVKEPGWATPDTLHLFNALPWASDPYKGDRDIPCPYGTPGDRLWVRESGWERPCLSPRDLREGADTWPPYEYDAEPQMCWADGELKGYGWKRRPSIHMPRWASRLALDVTAVRVERLRSISEEDARAEGVETWRAGWDEKTAATMFLNGTRARVATGNGPVATRLYMLLWEALNGAGSWNLNPWVWVVEFRRVRP